MFSSPEETFEWYANELRKISELSARYFLDDPYCKQGYRSEINEVIRLIRADFNIALYNNNARHQRVDSTRDWFRENIGSTGNWPDIYKYTEEIKLEYESEKLAYSQLRKASKELYNATRSYFGEGWLFYGDKSLDILGGAIQTAVGIFSYRIGKTIGSHGMKTSGAISMAYGGGRVYQGISDITYELTDGEINFRQDPVKFLIEQGTIALGGDSITAKKIYYDVDFVNNLYIGFGAFKIIDPKKRTEIRQLPTKISKGLRKLGFFERYFPDNVGFRIERWTSENYKRKLAIGNKPMLLYSLTASAIKLKLILELHSDEN
ncbi:hypothetical protein [Providencia rettgeri]|uniref:hypothetical protein n=1 Tax=Providencia rettgeri TaxID=587 RepID=UPI001657DC3F|nr:hypothetical protein [Providencia rettgeri]QNP20869.1 hypothetical protein H9L31_03000 [Providencia rettgeri]